MPRTIVDIPAELLAAVDPLCATLNISRAEAVRRGLLEFLRSHEAETEDGFGLWKQGDDEEPAA
jgi:metal-responsive CopG/Arc/MetJ family transcriptional regulator